MLDASGQWAQVYWIALPGFGLEAGVSIARSEPYMTHPSDSYPAKLLWTGGWDSTFQLLRLVLEQRRPVTTYYIIDEDRKSTGIELRALKRIKQAIIARDPASAPLLEPTRYFAKCDIPPQATITQAFNKLRERYPIGHQYDWLARFCAHQQISGLQLCITQALRRSSELAYFDRSCGMDAAAQQSPEHIVFQYFDFPTVGLTKKDMAEIVRRNGWDAIMALTWFCHHPRGNKPCGQCSPCQCAVKEGLAWRVPLMRRVLGPVRQKMADVRGRLKPGRRTSAIMHASQDHLSDGGLIHGPEAEIQSS